MIDLTIQTLGGPVKVRAIRVGEFLAVHRAPAVFGSGFWDLSHVHSGRKLGRFVSRGAAKGFGLAAEGEFAQLSCADPQLHAEERSDFLAMLRAHGGVMIQPRTPRC